MKKEVNFSWCVASCCNCEWLELVEWGDQWKCHLQPKIKDYVSLILLDKETERIKCGIKVD